MHHISNICPTNKQLHNHTNNHSSSNTHKYTRTYALPYGQMRGMPWVRVVPFLWLLNTYTCTHIHTYTYKIYIMAYVIFLSKGERNCACHLTSIHSIGQHMSRLSHKRDVLRRDAWGKKKTKQIK